MQLSGIKALCPRECIQWTGVKKVVGVTMLNVKGNITFSFIFH